MTATSIAIKPATVIPIQPRDTFKCPEWCSARHVESDLSPWDYGQWLVSHKGEPVEWATSVGTTMNARLKWVEIVGSSPIVVDGTEFLQELPTIDFGGDDGSGYMGVNSLPACDVGEWTRVLALLGEKAAS